MDLGDECTTPIISYSNPLTIEFLKTNTEFDTEFYDIGDGLSVSTWKHE